jgi:hypothetical protein
MRILRSDSVYNKGNDQKLVFVRKKISIICVRTKKEVAKLKEELAKR